MHLSFNCTHLYIHTCRRGFTLCHIRIWNRSHTHEHSRHPLVPRGGTWRGSDLWIPEEKPLIPGQVWANISGRHAPHTALIKTAEGGDRVALSISSLLYLSWTVYLKGRSSNFKADFSTVIWCTVARCNQETCVSYSVASRPVNIYAFTLNIQHSMHQQFDSLYRFKWGKKDFHIFCGRVFVSIIYFLNHTADFPRCDRIERLWPA